MKCNTSLRSSGSGRKRKDEDKLPAFRKVGGMKIAAMLVRGKGRDYYDVMFLLSQTEPDYLFLAKRCGIRSLAELKVAVEKSLQSIDLKQKQKDFEHLLFHRNNSRRILSFAQFIRSL